MWKETRLFVHCSNCIKTIFCSFDLYKGEYYLIGSYGSTCIIVIVVVGSIVVIDDSGGCIGYHGRKSDSRSRGIGKIVW